MNRKPRYKSTTLWLVIWSCAFLTTGLIINTDVSWFGGVSAILAGAIVTYIVGEKATLFKHGEEVDKKTEIK